MIDSTSIHIIYKFNFTIEWDCIPVKYKNSKCFTAEIRSIRFRADKFVLCSPNLFIILDAAILEHQYIYFH